MLLNEYFDYGNVFEKMQQAKCELFSQKENRICKARYKSFDKVVPSDSRNGTIQHSNFSQNIKCNFWEYNCKMS